MNPLVPTGRSERVSSGGGLLSLAQQYDTLRDPGRNQLRTLHQERDAAILRLYGFTDDEDPVVLLAALNESLAQEQRDGLRRA